MERLAEHGFEAEWSPDLAGEDAPDEHLCERAAAAGQVVLTADTDFGRILALSGADAPSILLLRIKEQGIEQTFDPALDAIRNHANALIDGAVVTVTETGSRVRPLPIIR